MFGPAVLSGGGRACAARGPRGVLSGAGPVWGRMAWQWWAHERACHGRPPSAGGHRRRGICWLSRRPQAGTAGREQPGGGGGQPDRLLPVSAVAAGGGGWDLGSAHGGGAAGGNRPAGREQPGSGRTAMDNWRTTVAATAV